MSIEIYIYHQQEKKKLQDCSASTVQEKLYSACWYKSCKQVKHDFKFHVKTNEKKLMENFSSVFRQFINRVHRSQCLV